VRIQLYLFVTHREIIFTKALSFSCSDIVTLVIKSLVDQEKGIFIKGHSAQCFHIVLVFLRRSKCLYSKCFYFTSLHLVIQEKNNHHFFFMFYIKLFPFLWLLAFYFVLDITRTCQLPTYRVGLASFPSLSTL